MPKSSSSTTVGARIRDRREALGWKQRDLARACDLDTVVIWKYEHERVSPSPSTAVRLAQALRVSLDWLFTGIESSFKTPTRKRTRRATPAGAVSA